MLEYWYEALRSECGIVLRTSTPQQTIQKLYQLRSDAKDPDLKGVSICQSPTTPGEIWLVKNERGSPSRKGNP